MRCPECQKFVPMEMGEPEPNLELEDARVTGDVRIVMNCTDCGTELKEATLEVSDEGELGDLEKCEEDINETVLGSPAHEFSLDGADSAEATERTEGKGRGMKTFRGFSMTVTVKCKCGKSREVGLADEVPASGDGRARMKHLMAIVERTDVGVELRTYSVESGEIHYEVWWDGKLHWTRIARPRSRQRERELFAREQARVASSMVQP